MRNVLKISDTDEVKLIKQGTFRYVQQMCEEGIGVRYGSMISSYIEADVYYGANDISVGDVIYYYQGRNVDNTFSPITPEAFDLIGIFTVERVIKGKKSYSFIAYDDIYKLDIDYSQELLSMKSQFPMRVEDFLDGIETYASNLGINIAVGDLTAYTMSSGSAVTIDYFYAEGITIRDILKYFAAISFRYTRCTPDGYIHFPYVEKFDTEGQSSWLSADRYIIAPTDQITYTGTADIGGVPTTVNLIPIFYKENGLSVGDYSFVTPGCCEVRGMSGEVIYNITNGSLSDGSYIISNNIAASKIENDAQWWSGVVDSQYGYLCNLLTNNSVVPFEVHLFPFRNPFFAGQLLPHIVDMDGTRYESVVMKMEITDFEVILTCSGAEKYYDDSSKNYDVAEEATSLSVAINDLKESLANKVSKSGDTITGNLDISGSLTIGTPLAIASGGTGNTQVESTSTKSEIADEGANISFAANGFSAWGKLAQIQLGFTPSANLSAGNIIATIKSGKRPVRSVYTLDSTGGRVEIQSNGNVIVRHAVSSGTTFYIYTPYLLA